MNPLVRRLAQVLIEVEKRSLPAMQTVYEAAISAVVEVAKSDHLLKASQHLRDAVREAVRAGWTARHAWHRAGGRAALAKVLHPAFRPEEIQVVLEAGSLIPRKSKTALKREARAWMKVLRHARTLTR